MNKWRVGHKVQINVYDGDRPVCQCHNVSDALMIVQVVNKFYQGVIEKPIVGTLSCTCPGGGPTFSLENVSPSCPIHGMREPSGL